ncbi:MAG: acetyl-CoA carboxylase biotin carboxylase subunit family protein [Sandaracinaceae bacterium]
MPSARSERPLSTPPAPRPRVLVVGGGPFQLDVIAAARELGSWVLVVDRNPDAPGMALADQALPIDTTDVDGVIRAAREAGVEGVLTAASDAAVAAVAAVGEALGLPAVPPGAAARCRDKLETFRCLDACGLAVPRTVLARDGSGVAAAVDEVGGLPVVLKPRSAAGGRGVTIVRDAADLPRAFARAARYGEGALVQRFVRGEAIGVEAFFWRGHLASALLMDDQFAPGIVSPVGHSIPSTLPIANQERVLDDVEAFARALDLRDGPANFDLRFEDGRTVLLEVNARLGGNSITDLVRSAYDVDLSAATIRASLGADPREDLVLGPPTPSAARIALKRGQGRAHVTGGIDELAHRPGVRLVELTVTEGEPARLRVDEHAIVGRCLVQAADPRQAARRAEGVASWLARKVELRP